MDITSGNVRFQISPGKTGVIPFNSAVSIKKTKPTSKLKKKVGDVWISAKGMSLMYVLATHMLQRQIRRIVGFYQYPQDPDKVVFLEVALDGSSVVGSMRLIDESPAQFLDMEGKTFDEMIGNVPGLTGTTGIDLDKIYKGLIPSIRPLFVAILGVTVIMLGVMVYQLVDMTGKQVEEQKPKERPALTVAETNYLSALQYAEMLDKYKALLGRLDKEVALKSVSMTLTATPHDVTYAVNVTYRSFYPFVDSKLDGKHYVFLKSETGTLTRELAGSIRKELKSPYLCLQHFMPYKITERSADEWTIRVEEKSHKKAAQFLMDTYLCPVKIVDFKMDDASLAATYKLSNDAAPVVIAREEAVAK